MRLELFLILIITVFSMSGCWSSPEATPPTNSTANRAQMPVNSAANPINSTNPADPANTAVNLTANQAVNQAVEQAIKQAGSPTVPQDISPINAFRALGEAGNKRDLRTLVQLFNRRSLEMFAGEASAKGQTMDEVMLSQRAAIVAKSLPQIRNEKITGDSATIEVRMGSGSWEKMYFTMEDGHWKVAIDKYMDEITRQVEESTKGLGRKPE